MIIKKQIISKQLQKIPFQLAQNQHALLIPMGDIHYGIGDFPTKKLQTNIEWGLDRGAMFIGMGDYFDFTSTSQRIIVSSMREEAKKEIDGLVKIQVEKFFQILEPTKKLWLGLIEGQHRWEFMDGTSSDQYLCQLLECDFLGTSTLINLHPMRAPREHPEANTMIFAHHGIGSARKAGGHLNRIEDILEWVEADIYLMGHSHAKIAAPIDYQIITPDGVHTHRTRILARTGSWFKAYSSTTPQNLKIPARISRGTYVERGAYTPTAMGSLCFGIGFEQIPHSRYYKPSIHCSI